MIGNWKAVCAALLLPVSAVAAAAHQDTPSSAKPAQAPLTTFYPGEAAGKLPGILVLGGAEGGDEWAKAVSRRLADHGYVAVAIAYFNSPGLEPQLQQIPIERLQQGLDRLAKDVRVDPRRIAVLGFSKGAEAALLLASLDPRIRAVVAGSPTDVVWQGIDRTGGAAMSSWTLAGRPLPYVPFAVCSDCRSLGALYGKSRENTSALAGAAIPVEAINGPILLLASEDDAVWPSDTMAKALQLRLKDYQFQYRIESISYRGGGHFTLGPTAPEKAEGDAGFGGGTADGVISARTQSWPQVIAFLAEAIPAGKP